MVLYLRIRITTGTLNVADLIDANAIHADKITAGTVGVRELTANSITADEIDADTITANDLLSTDTLNVKHFDNVSTDIKKSFKQRCFCAFRSFWKCV